MGEYLGRGEARVGALWIQLDVFEGKLVVGEPVALEHRALRWCTADELGALDWAEADVPVVPVVERVLRVGGDSG